MKCQELTKDANGVTPHFSLQLTHIYTLASIAASKRVTAKACDMKHKKAVTKQTTRIS
jgi:hypothetical protein